MSDEQKDAIVGRVMREHRENREHIGRLVAEAQKWGQKLNEISNGLMNHLEGVCPEGAGLDMNFAHHRVGFSNAEFDMTRLTALTNDYRTALKTKEHLENQLTQLGFPVPAEGYGYRR